MFYGCVTKSKNLLLLLHPGLFFHGPAAAAAPRPGDCLNFIAVLLLSSRNLIHPCVKYCRHVAPSWSSETPSLFLSAKLLQCAGITVFFGQGSAIIWRRFRTSVGGLQHFVDSDRGSRVQGVQDGLAAECYWPSPELLSRIRLSIGAGITTISHSVRNLRKLSDAENQVEADKCFK